MEFSKRMWIGIVILAACARLLPHPWNFTPIVAIGLFAGNQARSVYTGILATLLALVLSDAVLGFDSSFWYVYGAWLIPVLLGRLTRNRDGVGALVAAALGSSVSFFLITACNALLGSHDFEPTLCTADSDCASSFSWCGNIRSIPPP